MITLYGISNCITVKKARKWLEEKQVNYTFFDYKKSSIDQINLNLWCQKFGWEKVLNRQGLMWKKASEADKNQVIDQQSAIEFMLKVPSSVKRPILELANGELILGFDTPKWEQIFL